MGFLNQYLPVDLVKECVANSKKCYTCKYSTCILPNNIDWSEMKEKMYIQNFTIEKSKKIFNYFTCILPDSMANGVIKEFWKNSHFENMTASFLLRCQNSLRQTSPKIMHFQRWKN